MDFAAFPENVQGPPHAHSGGPSDVLRKLCQTWSEFDSCQGGAQTFKRMISQIYEFWCSGSVGRSLAEQDGQNRLRLEWALIYDSSVMLSREEIFYQRYLRTRPCNREGAFRDAPQTPSGAEEWAEQNCLMNTVRPEVAEMQIVEDL